MTKQEIIERIMLLSRQRNQLMNAEFRTNNHFLALERMAAGKPKGKRKVVMTPKQIEFAQAIAAKVNPILKPALKAFHKERIALDRELGKLAEQLPEEVYSWAMNIRGVGRLGLSLIIGATGDLSKYSGPSKVWKRLGIAVIDGERQRKIAGKTPEKKLLAIRHGFNPTRRALVYNISEALMKQNRGEYKTLYDERKALELERLPDIPKGRKAWAHQRALRYMVRRFILHLWCKWNGKPLSLAQSCFDKPKNVPSQARPEAQL